MGQRRLRVLPALSAVSPPAHQPDVRAHAHREEQRVKQREEKAMTKKSKKTRVLLVTVTAQSSPYEAF